VFLRRVAMTVKRVVGGACFSFALANSLGITSIGQLVQLPQDAYYHELSFLIAPIKTQIDYPVDAASHTYQATPSDL
jgi:hypothetical protein